MILELKGIYKEYQQGKMKVPVLKDVNFSMDRMSRAGERHGICIDSSRNETM